MVPYDSLHAVFDLCRTGSDAKKIVPTAAADRDEILAGSKGLFLLHFLYIIRVERCTFNVAGCNDLES